jgi:hypothetical protein
MVIDDATSLEQGDVRAESGHKQSIDVLSSSPAFNCGSGYNQVT